MKFLLCATDEQTFIDHINQFPVVGIAERFVIPSDVFLCSDDMLKEELEELGITLLSVI